MSDSSYVPAPTPTRSGPTIAERLVALLEVLICSDYPTQIAIGGTFAAAGYGPYVNGHLRLSYVVGVSLADSVVLVGLIVLFLHVHGERARDVVIGHRPILREAGLGALLLIPVLVVTVTVLGAIEYLAPSLHTVPENPIEQLLGRPRDMFLFAIVVIIAGGIREEVQRAFLLHRFDVWLGGPAVGLVVTSVAFGAGHLLQGADAALTIGLLGAFWAAVYLRRRSAIAPMVSHAGFDLLQLLRFLVFGG
jgi:membrane protease YdiL (CAAX protease family)